MGPVGRPEHVCILGLWGEFQNFNLSKNCSLLGLFGVFFQIAKLNWLRGEGQMTPRSGTTGEEEGRRGMPPFWSGPAQ